MERPRLRAELEQMYGSAIPARLSARASLAIVGGGSFALWALAVTLVLVCR